MSKRIRQTIPDYPPAEARTWKLQSWELDTDGDFPGPDHSWAVEEPKSPTPRLRRLLVRVCPRCGLGRTRLSSVVTAVSRCPGCGAINVRWRKAPSTSPSELPELD